MNLQLVGWLAASVFIVPQTVASEVRVAPIPAREAAAVVEASQPEAPPQQRVAALNTALLEAMKNADEVGYRQRYDRLAPIIMQSFDFAGMTRVAAGRFLGDFSQQDSDALTQGLARLTIASFASQFDGFLDHRFEITGSEPGPNGAVLVHTQLISPYRPPLNIGYMMYPAPEGNGWKIYDIYLGSALSLLSLRRSEYASILTRDGIGGLVREIDRRVAYLTPGNTWSASRLEN